MHGPSERPRSSLPSLLAACAGAPAKNDAPASGELLRNSLPVAAAALAAGQLDVARRLYLSLAERFKDAPEPALGLGYVELYSGDFLSDQTKFLQAADLKDDKPTVKAEALLGAGRHWCSDSEVIDQETRG